MQVALDRQQGANAWLTVGIREGKNREVRRAMEAVGLIVNRLIRTGYGPFQLGDLAPGAVEEVRPRVLRDQLGIEPAAEQEPRRGPRHNPADAPSKRSTPAGKHVFERASGPKLAARSGPKPEQEAGWQACWESTGQDVGPHGTGQAATAPRGPEARRNSARRSSRTARQAAGNRSAALAQAFHAVGPRHIVAAQVLRPLCHGNAVGRATGTGSDG
jgi:23S rRNA pseudouridine2605 synthase